MRMLRKNAQRFLGLVMCCVMLAGMLSAWPLSGLAKAVDKSELTSGAGVYGWRIVDQSGVLIGGVRYPGNAGGGPVMNLENEAGDKYFPGIQATPWGQYVDATVLLGTADVSTPESRSAFAETIKQNYQVEVFMVDVDGGEYDAETGEYPYAWVTYDITDAVYTAEEGQTPTYTLAFDGSDALEWDFDNRTQSAARAVFAVTVDRAPDLTAAGVYGWRIRDKSGALVGGVGYPNGGNAGTGSTAMNLNDYLASVTRFGWGQYEGATVSLGSIDTSLMSQAEIEAYAQEIKDSYTLEIFYVETSSDFINGKYPCGWIPCDVAVDYVGYNTNDHIQSFTFRVSDPINLRWDYSTIGQNDAVFTVTVTEPERLSSNKITAWGVEVPGTNTYVENRSIDYYQLGGGVYTAILEWPYDYKTAKSIDAITDADMKPFVDDFKANYQLRVARRISYNPDTDDYIEIPVKNMEIDQAATAEADQGYIVLKVTPAVAHNLRWHWHDGWNDTNADWSTTQYNLNFRISVRIVNAVSDETAKAHLVTSSVVNPPNTTVNFFDYWLEPDGRWENDFEAYPMGTESDVIKRGINNGHLLVFMGSFAFPGAQGCNNVSNLGRWNVWTGDEHYAPYPDSDADVNGGYGSYDSSVGRFTADTNDPDGILKPHRGIVAQTLKDGYPALALGGAAWLTSSDFAYGRSYGNEYPTYDLMQGHFEEYFEDVLADQSKGGESLAYLFNPDMALPYKAVVPDAKGLFQMDSEGYYYFNSRVNFAELVENGAVDDKGNPINIVNLYDEPWKVSASVDVDNDTAEAKGQFFPFNEWKSLFHETGNGSEVEQDHFNFRDQNRTAERPINHYFGMTVETEFQQPISGTITQGRVGGGRDIPMEFYFSGDDDVWIFIDDVLVGDIGGIHNPVSININFATGVIEYTALDAPNGRNTTPYYTTSIREMFEAAGASRIWETVDDIDGQGTKGYIFPNGSIHTLKFYYMERGNDVSDCSIRFNTLPVSKDSIRKVDDSGEILRNALFDLYEAVPNGSASASAWHTVSEFDRVAAPIAKGLHIDNDKENPNLYTILDADGKVIDFTEYVKDLNQPTYFILDETKVPAGFRANPGIVLEFHPETYTFTVLNKYETGAYASFSAEWKQILAVYDATFDESTGKLNKGHSIADPMKDGLTVVVPLIKTGANWLPMFGSNTKGWNTVERGKDTLKTDLALAALLQIADEDYPNWYMNWINSGSAFGNLIGNMVNLPGDATRYVINQTTDNGHADLTLVALFLPKATLDKMGIAGATDDERYEKLHQMLTAAAVTDVASARSFLTGKNADEGNFTLLYSNDFARSYRTVIYVPNERRELRVRKVDEEGEYVNGAVFALFNTAESAAAYTTKATDLNGVMAELAGNKGGSLLAFGATATVDLGSAGGQQDGMLIFREDVPGNVNSANGYAQIDWPDQRVAENGVPDTQDTIYWLKEIYAPTGYVLNENLVRVEVGNVAIYANATGYDVSGHILTGEAAANDGITVQAMLGKLTQTLTKYAIGNKVDVTLQDITITKQVNQETDKLPADGSGWSDAQPAESFNLHYGLNAGALTSQYGPHEASAEPPVFTATDGYIRVMPRQNQTTYADHDSIVKRDNLNGVDLDGLFGLMNVVVVENRKLTGNLSVSKQVTGEGLSNSDTETEFSFIASFTGRDGKPLSGTYSYISGDGKQEGNFTLSGIADEVITFMLAHGQTINIYGLPTGTTFTVVENANPQYTVTVTDAKGNPSEGKGTILADVSAGVVFVNKKIPEPPTVAPTDKPTDKPTEKPTDVPTEVPTAVPTAVPTDAPTDKPTNVPTNVPTEVPTLVPTESPTDAPTVPPTGSLTVTKTVELGSKKKDFTFSVTLSDKSINGTYGSMYFKNGEATFTLHDGQSKTATGLPVGIRYAVVETSANTDGYHLVSSTGDWGMISEQGSTAAFVNVSVPETGDNSHLELWLALLAASIVSIVIIAKKRSWMND